MRRSMDPFLKNFDLSQTEVVRMNQIHGNNLEVVGIEDLGKTITETDGLFTEQNKVYLTAVTADCLPMLIFDSEKQNIALLHLGWKGTLTNLVSTAVESFEKTGSNLEDLIVGFGPAIGVCCYNVEEDRAQKFKERFGAEVVKEREGKVYLDLFRANYLELLALGLNKLNIQAGVFCTVDHSNLLYSSRAEGKIKGECVSLIGIKNE